MKVFIGYDSRQPLAYHVARSSVERHAKQRVQIEPLRLDWLPMTRKGLTEFTFSRYLVPWLCDYRGVAIFMDADTIVQADVHELAALRNPGAPVSVAQGPLRFEWSSVMVFNCDNFRCRTLTPEWVDDEANQPQKLEWGPVGSFPLEWNHLVGYYDPNPDAKLIHFTAGIPCWPETAQSEHAAAWLEEFQAMRATCSWEALMGQSVHRRVVEAMRG